MANSRHGKRSRSKKIEKTYRVLGCMKNTKKKIEKHEKRINNGREIKKIRVWTHQGVDLDAVISVWLVLRFMYPGLEYELIFVPAGYNGTSIDGDDIAVDIEAGGKGIKSSIDKDGNKHSSCYTIFRRACLSDDNYRALCSLISVVDKRDIYGKLSLVPEDIGHKKDDGDALNKVEGLSFALRVFKNHYKEEENADELVCEKMFDVLDSLLEETLESKKFKAEVERKSFRCGNVFVVETSQRFSVARHVFNNPDNKAYIYVNPQKNSLGVYLSDDFYHNDGFRLRFKDLKPIVAQFNENIGKGENEWFLHEDGFLFAWGTKKDIRPKPSKIRPEELALEINRLIENFYNIQNKKFPR